MPRSCRWACRILVVLVVHLISETAALTLGSVYLLMVIAFRQLTLDIVEMGWQSVHNMAQHIRTVDRESVHFLEALLLTI